MYNIFLQVWGLFGDSLMLPVFGRNASPWKLLYHFAVSREIRRAAPVSATRSNSVLSLNVTLIQLCSGRICRDGWMSLSQGPGCYSPVVSLQISGLLLFCGCQRAAVWFALNPLICHSASKAVGSMRCPES